MFLHWECGVLTTRPPGKSPRFFKYETAAAGKKYTDQEKLKWKITETDKNTTEEDKHHAGACEYSNEYIGSDSKESACNVGDPGLIPGLGRPPGEGNGNPLQYSCLENSMDRGAYQAKVHGVANSQTWLSNSHTHIPK